MNNKNSEYFLGLDIGTGSIGWAVTNTDYEILKKNRRPTIGSVLFATANGAEETRIFRCSRRRNKRVKERVKLLQELLADEINKVDLGFYLRMKESKYVFEDKRDLDGKRPELPYSLFVDKNYTDEDYYAEYPTIYHLRYALINEDRKFDIRLIYLAIEHILKHRGHFLSNLDVKNIGDSKEFKNMLDEFIKVINELFDDINLSIEEDSYDKIKAILTNENYNKAKKQEEFLKELELPKNKIMKEIAKLITGGTATLKNLFSEKEIEDDCKSITFESAAYEENEDKYISMLGDDFELIAMCRAIYNWMKLSDILGKSKAGYISEVKIALYDKHKSDLKLLKAVVKQYLPDSYKLIFGVANKDTKNYSAYVGMVKKNGVKVPIEKTANQKDFYDFLNKKVIKPLAKIEDERIAYIKSELDNNSFLPKQKTSDNSIIPYQIHELELLKILENASKHYDFLLESDDEGITVKQKIHSIMTFRIPYYVGPLNAYHKDKANGHAWIERKEEGKIYPWNFDKKVDIEASAAKFIERMINKCTYLKDEDVLPKRSLLYEKFMVLNELNNLKIKGEPITVELKQKIYHCLFEKHKKITNKRLREFLKSEGVYTDITKDDITGIDGDFTNSLNSYMAFKELFTDSKLTDDEKEDIIRDITLFGADEKLLKKRLNRKYPGNEKRMNKLINKLKSDAWGRLSKKFLEGEELAIEINGSGNIGTIMYQLWNTNNNLMKLLSKDYPYLDMIDRLNGNDKVDKFSYNLVKDLYVSPATKRQIWKALQIVKEVERFMGRPPKRIFIEMAREKQVSKRSVARKAQLLELYKSIKKEEETLYKELEGMDNDSLRRDKLYLYFTQMGRCAYTGRDISIDELYGENSAYDIDHIYPQSKTADDSLDNRVLVYKPYNHKKSDVYPLEASIRNARIGLWNTWLSKKLISREKYNRLTRTTELTRDELMGFVNRQLVETRQSTKAVTELLRKLMPDSTEIVFVKAGNVSRFRHQFDLIKIREMNDFHHAKDAYLNIVVGNAYHLYFTKDIRKYFMERGTYRTYNLMKLFDKNDIKYKDEYAWKTGEGATIATVKKVMQSNKVLVTEQVYEQTGQLFDLMPLKKGKGQIPLKDDERLNDIKKYGGYNSATIAYFSIVSAVNKKGKKFKYIVPIPLRLKNLYENDEIWALAFLNKQVGSNKVEKVLKKKLLFKTRFVYQGFNLCIAGKADTQIIFHNRNQAIFDVKTEKCLKELFKFKNELKDSKEKAKIKSNSILLEENTLDNLYKVFLDKLSNTIYKNVSVYEGAIKTIGKGKSKFENLSPEDKANTLLEIFKLFQCTPEMPKLSLIGGSNNMGVIRFSTNISNREKMLIVNQSVTGIYETIERIDEM